MKKLLISDSTEVSKQQSRQSLAKYDYKDSKAVNSVTKATQLVAFFFVIFLAKLSTMDVTVKFWEVLGSHWIALFNWY